MEHETIGGEGPASVEDVADLMQGAMADGLDHPELWAMIPGLVDQYPKLVRALQWRLEVADPATAIGLKLLLGVAGAAMGDAKTMLEILAPLKAQFGRSQLVQGAITHIEGLAAAQKPA